MPRHDDRRCAACGGPIYPDGYVRVIVQRVHDGLREERGRMFKRPEAHMVVPRLLLCGACADEVVERMLEEVRS